MLPKKHRLKKNNDFADVAKNGKAFFSREISLKWIENNLPFSRFGITVSLKVDKRATTRNKINKSTNIEEILGLIKKLFYQLS